MGYEIRNGKLDDINSLKLLWEDVFGDDIKYIDRFFQNIFMTENAFVAVDGGVPVGMMFMLPATLIIGESTFKAGYIYAVATDKNYRGQGIMSALERYVCEKAAVNGISVLALVPANRQLFNMYKKTGYQTVFYKASTIITPIKGDKSELINCTLDFFLEERKSMLKEYKSYLELDCAWVKYRYETLNENAQILLYKDNVEYGYIVGQKSGSHYKIFETNLSFSTLGKAAYAISEKYYKLKKISVVGKIGTLTPYGMLKSLDNRVNIYDIIKLNPYMNLMLE